MKKQSINSAGVQIAVVLLLLILASTGYKYYKTTQRKPYRVLVLHSFKDYYTWGEDINNGISDCFDSQQVKANFKYAYLNSEFMNSQDEENYIKSLLDEEMSSPPDLILVCDDQATYSLLAAGHSLAHKIPIVFSGVDYPNKNVLNRYDNVTGFTTKPDFMKCIKLIKYIYPDTKYYNLCITRNVLGENAAILFQEQTASMKKSEIKINSIETNSVLNLGWLFAASSLRFIVPNWDSFYSELIRNYDHPYFLVNNEGFGNGPLGGYMTLSYDQGYLAADRGIEILKGKKISELPITLSPKKEVFDWIQMERFNIHSSQLPPDAVIINMPFYVRYKYPVIIGTLFLFVIIIGSTILFIQLYLRERQEKRQALSRLQDHKNMLDIAMRSICEAVISVDKNLCIFTINRAALEWLGLNTDASLYIGKNVRALLNITTPLDSQNLETMLSRLFTEYKDSTFESETKIESLTTQRILSVSGELSGIYQDGELYGVVITFHDITQEIIRKKFLSLSMSAGNVFSWQFNRLTEMFVFDQSFFLQLNLPIPDNGQISFRQIKTKIYPEDIMILQDTITKVRRGNARQITRQIRINLSGKGYTWWEFRLTVIPDQANKTGNLIYGLLFNIQSFKEIEEELTRSYTKAEQSEKLKSAFLANMSHEIRTPLNGIVGFSNLLTSGEEFEPEETQVFIKTIRKNCDLLLALITDILDLATIESNNMSFKFKHCDVNALVEQIVMTQRVIIPEHLHLICEIPEQTVYMMTDPLRLNQVLTNLTNNAIKFTPQGSITIGYTTDEPGFLNFFVEDTGKGISPKDLDSVFVRFFKKDDFTQGAGLGLSICKMIVDRLRGNISVTSKLGVGTRFTVRIPWEIPGNQEEKEH